MTLDTLNAWVAAPEIFLLCAACVLLILDLFVSQSQKKVTYWLTLLVIALTSVLSVQSLCTGLAVAAGDVPGVRSAFSGMYVADPLADFAKLGMLLSTALALVYGRAYAEARGLFRGEMFALVLFALLGMMVMASATHFVTLYVGLELLSLAVYALVAMQRDEVRSTEAAMKYFVLGAVASGMLLYGMSMIYGATASLDVHQVAARILEGNVPPLLVVFGTVFIVAGLAFKLGAVPFHMWVPDVYEGAPTFLAQLIGSAPKIAALVFVVRILGISLEQVANDWSQMLIVLSVLSLAVGNIVAIAQTSIKRMLAYSTISHMGFLLLGVLVHNQVGYAAALFYVVTYALTTAAGFGMLLLLSRSGFEADRIEDFKGLAKSHPWYAFLMLMVMFSMAGIPVFVGFFAKLSVLSALVASNLVWLAVVAVVFSLIGAFYYLRVVKVMYFDEPVVKHELSAPLEMRVVLSANGLLLLGLGLFPQPLLSALSHAMQVSLQLAQASALAG